MADVFCGCEVPAANTNTANRNGKRASDYHRLPTAEAQPEADVFCGCQVQV